MKLPVVFAALGLVLVMGACGGSDENENDGASSAQSIVTEPEKYDPKRGEGKWTEENVTLNTPLNEEWVTSGKSISDVKCTSCHKLSAEKLVGPGWSGVTTRRTPVWLMNFITNPDPMLDKDPEAQAMLELCLVRMPNQSLSDGEARNILEFMLRNDGTK